MEEKRTKTEPVLGEALAPTTIFDDVFRTLAQKMPELLIPLVNEVFHTDYSEDQAFEQLRNEHYEKYGKVITDSILRIEQHMYHIECQSKRDGNMTIRMVEYDFAIALEYSTAMAEGILELEFPQSCVLYIRNHRGMPEAHRAIIRFPDGQNVIYDIPIIMAQDYSVNHIFEKRLLLLLPFHILRHERFLKSAGEDQKKVKNILKEYETIVQKLNAFSNEKEKSYLYVTLIGLIQEVANYVIREDHPVREGLGEIMGGNIIKLPHEIILEQGIEMGELTSMVALVCRRLRQGDTPEKIKEFIGEESINISQICEIAAQYAPEFDVKKIIEDIQGQKTKN